MKKKTDYTIETLLFVLLLALMGTMIGCKPQGKQYYLDLPEEINGSNGQDLQVELRNDTFYISFRTEVYNH